MNFDRPEGVFLGDGGNGWRYEGCQFFCDSEITRL